MWKPKLNPVTQKRLKRFASIRRSYWSLWILLGLYGCSLLANLISNENPLLVRYEGRFFFPTLFYYPDDTFSGSGIQSRPDYKTLNRSEAFAETEGNYMVFPLVPFGPFETLEASEVVVDDAVNVVVTPQQLVASVNLDDEFEIQRALGLAAFVDAEDDRGLRGESVASYLILSDELKTAIAARLTNDAELPAYDEELAMVNGNAVQASLSRYKPRSRAPSSVRLTLREILPSLAKVELVFSVQGELETRDAFWSQLDEVNRTKIGAAVLESIEGDLKPLAFVAGGESYVATFQSEEVNFPFRPTRQNWFGLDSSGRDVLSRVLYGLRISLNFGMLLVVFGMGIGIVVGGIQGYKGGRTDLLGQRFTEIWEALPFLYIMIFMGSVFGRSFLLLLLVYGAFSWIGISYYMRGEFLKLRKQPFVEAAHCLGLPDWKIMLRHILPNSLVPVITFFPFSLVGAIFSLSALDFLGFGMPPPTPSWGELLSQAQEFKHAWWLVLYPSLTLFLVILLAVFIGEGIRAAFDPRVNSKYES